MSNQNQNQKSPFPPSNVISPNKPNPQVAGAGSGLPSFGAPINQNNNQQMNNNSNNSMSGGNNNSASASGGGSGGGGQQQMGYAQPLSQKQIEEHRAASAAAAAKVVTATTGPESILNFSVPLDINVFDQVATAFFIDGNKQVSSGLSARYV